MERLPAPAGFLGRALATVVTLVVGVGLFMFSIVVFAVILVVGLGFGAYVWWQTRGLRRAVREQITASNPNPNSNATTTSSVAANTSATIIEGEYVRLDDSGRELPRRDQ